MLVSMTGFGRSVRKTPLGRLTAEIQSINRKYLELNVNLPKELSLYEMEIRKWVSEKIGRGQVVIRLYLAPNEDSLARMLPDRALLQQLKETWTSLALDLDCDPTKVDLPFLLQSLAGLPQSTSSEYSDEKLQILKESITEALDQAVAMKRLEGSALESDISQRILRIRQFVQEIEALSPNQILKQRARLSEKMKEVLQPGSDLDERLLREVALFSERVDIAEEIIRLRSHLEQFLSVTLSNEGAVGRKLEFVVQEIGREINTIGSKSQDAEIARFVIEAKSELEKIREQIQNIE